MTSSPREKSFFGSFDISYPAFWFVLLALFQVNLAWAQTGSRSADPSTQLKDPAPVDFASNELLPVNWSGSKARGVFYRPSKDNNHPVLRVYVAGRYQAGLLPDSFSELCLPVGEQSVQFLAGQAAKLRTGRARLFASGLGWGAHFAGPFARALAAFGVQFNAWMGVVDRGIGGR